MRDGWEVVIGLEVHAQVSSNSKLFSASSTDFGAEPNTQVSFFDAAMPGMLPMVNTHCIEQAIRTGLAISGEINLDSRFDRKNYFYPDLPQGYQITQFYEPIVKNGKIIMDKFNNKAIRIGRIHLEQDAGKSIHEDNCTYIDLNRAGVALMEIVSEPDLRSSQEAAEYVKRLRMILRYVGSCDGDMEKGSLRCDANVSVRRHGSSEYGSRCEIKNLNSVRHIVQAIDFEANRQIEIIEGGGVVEQNTMLFDVDSGETRIMRSKEDSSEYRYFPEPDILPIVVEQKLVDSLRTSMPEMPEAKKHRYVTELGLSHYDADVIISDRDVADYFEQVVESHDKKLAASWITGELFGRLNKLALGITDSPVSAAGLSALLGLIENNTISGKIAKQVFDVMFKTGRSATEIVQEQGMQQITDESALRMIIEDVIASNPTQVAAYKAGKDKLFAFFVGQVMKKTGGKANPDIVNTLIRRLL